MMMTPTAPQEQLTRSLRPKNRAKWVADLAKQKIIDRLNHLHTGQLTLIDGGETHTFGQISDDLHAIIHIHDSRFYGEIAFGGSIGAGEAYMLGYWTTDHLTDLIRIMCLNQSVMDTLEGGYHWLSKPILKMLH